MGNSKRAISSSIHSSKQDLMKSSNESLSSADTGYSLPPPVPERQMSQDIVDRAEVEVQTISIEPIKIEPTKVDASTITQRPKSVSFGDNEYLPLLSHNEGSEPSDDINQLFFDEYKRQNSQEDDNDDGYEIPIKYSHGPRARSQQTKPVKSILRSPSPSSASTTMKTTLSSLDRPLRMARVPVATTTVTTTAVIHTAILPSSDEEIEHENPFRKEFLMDRPYENIYEELNFEGSSSSGGKSKIEKDLSNVGYSVAHKQWPKSSYFTDTSREYSEIPPKARQSNENLIETTNEAVATQKTSQSADNLVGERPKQKPPLPPKPKAITAPIVKHADIKQNKALKQFQQEMLHGDLYEFVHDTETNQITRIKQQTTNIAESNPKKSSVDATITTIAKDNNNNNRSFHQANPLPPIPKTNIPSYSKVYKRSQSVERPTVSPPPPPINLSTLPTADKLKSIHPNDESQIEILPAQTSSNNINVSVHRVPEKCQENSSDYSLVTEEAHREILLQENEIRNAMQNVQEHEIITGSVVSSSRIPVRKAPLPPTNEQKTKQMQQQCPQNACSPSFSSINNNINNNNNNQMHSIQQTTSSQSSTSTAQIFPVTQILPVQYSNLPMPQQPDYFLTLPTPDQMNCNTISMPPSNAFSTFMVSDNNATQTANISSNIMSHNQHQQQQQHHHQISNSNITSVPYLQQQQPSFITVPISTFQTMNHHHQPLPHFQGPNYVNMSQASSIPMNINTLSHCNRSKYMFDAYRGNYNESLLRQQNYRYYQTQPLLQCQQDTNMFNLQTHPLQSNVQVDNLSSDPGLNRMDKENNNKPKVGTTPYSSLTTIFDSQIHIRNEQTCPTENFYDIPEAIEPTDEPNINTIGKQTAV